MKKTSEKRNCIHCGKTFEIPQYRVKRGDGKYCSMECYLNHRWKSPSGKCRECDKACSTIYCSDECRKNFWNRSGYVAFQKASKYWKRKIKILELLGSKCAKCGITDIRCLDIHHIDHALKTPAKGRHFTWSRRLKDWEKNLENLQILCANCHRITTWEESNYGKGVPHNNFN